MGRILYQFLASLARLAVRSGHSKDLKIIVLRHQLTLLQRQVSRPQLNNHDRTLLAAIAATLPRRRRTGWIVTPDTGELLGLGHPVGASTVWRILKSQGIDPAPQLTSVTWTQFLRSQAAGACDFATVDTALLHRYYLLFFIDITTREVFFAGITANPTGPWTTQAARNLFLHHPDRFVDCPSARA